MIFEPRRPTHQAQTKYLLGPAFRPAAMSKYGTENCMELKVAGVAWQTIGKAVTLVMV
jgi:hypothetical protein